MYMKFWLLNLIHIGYTQFFIKIINIPIYNCGLCNFHDIVLAKMDEFNVNDTMYKNLYAIDFCPCENYMDSKVIKKLLLGKSIPGKIQVHYIDKVDIDSLTTNFNTINKKLVSVESIKKIDSHLYKLLQSWNTSYHLYKHNCQSFSHYIRTNAYTIDQKN